MARSATPTVFFDQAMRTLAGPGRGGLRIGPLCAAVGVTSGSFYHHFGSWDGFVAALLEHWATEEVDRIGEIVRARTDPLERIALLKDLSLSVPHEAEAAIRAWSGTDPVVAAAQRRVDEGRRAVLVDVLAPVVADTELRATLAEVGMGILIGHQTLRGEGPGADLADKLDQFELLVRAHARGELDGVGTTLGSEPAPWAARARPVPARGPGTP